MVGSVLKNYIESIFPVIKERSSSQELIIVCPNSGCPDETGNRSINISTGKTNCWRCNSGGDAVKWLRYLGYQIDLSPGGTTVDDFYSLFIESTVEPVTPRILRIELPDGFTECSRNMGSVYTRWIGRMAHRKNLVLDDLLRYNVGFTRINKLWSPYAIFPVSEFDTVVYYQGRTYDDDYANLHLKGTKRFPSKEEVKLSSKYWVYGIDRARNSKVDTVVVVESILNVISLNKKFEECGIKNIVAISSFRSSITYPQIVKIFRLRNIKEVCILFDLDATNKAWNIAEMNSGVRNMTVAKMPNDSNNKKMDPNDNVDVALECILKRKKFSLADKLLDEFSSTQ